MHRPSPSATPDQSLQVLLPANLIESAGRTQPLLRGLLATGAGFAVRTAKHFPLSPDGSAQAWLIYCVRGRGWCEAGGHLHAVRRGDILVCPPDKPWRCGARLANPWTVYWVRATGALVPEYLAALPRAELNPIRHVDDDLQLVRLFSEILDSLRRGSAFAQLLRASSSLGYLLSLLIQKPPENPRGNSDVVSKVAETIIYMSSHLDEPLRVTALARRAGLSPAYFGELFKEQTGCAPRDYLHLLRIHRACQLLDGTEFNIKEIARRLGYLDQFHFSRQFKAFQGLSPSEYRRRRAR